MIIIFEIICLDDLFLKLTSAKRSYIGNNEFYNRDNVHEDLIAARNLLEFDSLTGRQKQYHFAKINFYSGYADGECLDYYRYY